MTIVEDSLKAHKIMASFINLAGMIIPIMMDRVMMVAVTMAMIDLQHGLRMRVIVNFLLILI